MLDIENDENDTDIKCTKEYKSSRPLKCKVLR